MPPGNTRAALTAIASKAYEHIVPNAAYFHIRTRSCSPRSRKIQIKKIHSAKRMGNNIQRPSVLDLRAWSLSNLVPASIADGFFRFLRLLAHVV